MSAKRVLMVAAVALATIVIVKATGIDDKILGAFGK